MNDTAFDNVLDAMNKWFKAANDLACLQSAIVQYFWIKHAMSSGVLTAFGNPFTEEDLRYYEREIKPILEQLDNGHKYDWWDVDTTRRAE